MPNVKVLVDTKIAGKKVMVFSKSYCPYCMRAKTVLGKHIGPGKEIGDDEYEVMELDKNRDCESIQDYLRQLTGGRSVPRIFINGKSIGGSDEILALEQRGQLKALLLN